MKKKAFMDISFSWIFAILVGGMILFGAIYGINKFSEVKELESSAKSGTTLNNLLGPLETGIESGKSVEISFPIESRLNNNCNSQGTFGRQIISVQEKIKGAWSTGIDLSFQNKYLFFPSSLEGKKFKVFTKPFEFPFKVANLMYLTNAEDNYCFISPPTSIKKELENLKQENLLTENCPEGSINICFATADSNCQIKVDYSSRKEVTKGTDKVYFEGDALMYAAIFSDKEVYECEVERLMKRTEQLALIYQEKAATLRSSNCNSNLNTDLSTLVQKISSYEDSSDLAFFSTQIKTMNVKNKNSGGCTLW